jgi:hypothetical protein
MTREIQPSVSILDDTLDDDFIFMYGRHELNDDIASPTGFEVQAVEQSHETGASVLTSPVITTTKKWWQRLNIPRNQDMPTKGTDRSYQDDIPSVADSYATGETKDPPGQKRNDSSFQSSRAYPSDDTIDL